MRVGGAGIETGQSQLASKGAMKHGLKKGVQAAAAGGLLGFQGADYGRTGRVPVNSNQ